MRRPSSRSQQRTIAVTLACSLVIFVAQGCVFAALGIALDAMRASLGWTAQDAGTAFSVMVVGACVGAALPARLIGWVGARATMAGGMVMLATSFALASVANTPLRIDLAMALCGVSFSQVANSPALYLISGWAGPRTGHHIGLYLTAAALGNAIAPPIAEAVIATGWAVWWRWSAGVALALAVLLAAVLRAPPRQIAAPRMRIPWGWSYAVLVAVMVLGQTGMLTVSSVAPAHLTARGMTPGAIATILGGQGLVGAVATAFSGWLTKAWPAARLLWLAVLAQGLGTLALAVASPGLTGAVMAWGFVLVYGFGMPMVIFAVTMLLVERFGREGGTAGLGFIWTAAGLAAVGPYAAGISADVFSGQGPALVAMALVLVGVAQMLHWSRNVESIN